MLSQLVNAIILGMAFAAAALADSGGVGKSDPSDPIAGKSHWAFQPLADRRPAPSADPSWPKGPIDVFILAGIQSAGLQPAADAPRRTLLRRAFFQLTGLPPTSEQTKAFLADERPDAFERVVDQLLGSPQFGERWGRHWLDLARYADSNGLDENFLFREAWRYRNWVIDAINEDVSFDRFALEQIAGDTAPFRTLPQRDRQRIAAGFLVIGPKVLLGNDAKKQRMEVADEQIETIGRTFLGLTLGCARCHDHKFEPVPRADYYAMAGIMTSTHVMEQRYMLGEQRVMERLVGLGPDGDALNANYEKYWREAPKLKERANMAKSALKFLEQDDCHGFLGVLEKHPDALAEPAKDYALPDTRRLESQKSFTAELVAALSKPPKIPERAMIPSDAESPSDEAIRVAGQFDRVGEQVPRGFLRVLSQGEPARIPKGKSGRTELAHWLTDVSEGAGALAARVMANRIWHHLIGRGIVRTVDNFGRTGEAPSHPELLDYLALELVRSDWSVKALVRKVVLSRTFAMSSSHDKEAHRLDPDNNLHWRAHRRRLDPEALRDAMLASAGQLDLARLNSSVWYLGDQATAVGKNEVRRRTNFQCRSVYLPVIRNDLPELFQAFDFGDPHVTTGARPQTSSASQGLFMLNDRMVMDTAEAMARRLLASDPAASKESRVDRLFDWVLTETPSVEERNAFLSGIQEFEKRAGAESTVDPVTRAWTVACHAALSMSRFQFLE